MIAGSWLWNNGRAYWADFTNESAPVCRIAAQWVCCGREHGLISFEAREANTHFWDDAYEDGTEAFVESKRILSSNGGDGFEQTRICTLSFCQLYTLRSKYVVLVYSYNGGLNVYVKLITMAQSLTFVFWEAEDSCMLTFTVSGKERQCSLMTKS